MFTGNVKFIISSYFLISSFWWWKITPEQSWKLKHEFPSGLRHPLGVLWNLGISDARDVHRSTWPIWGWVKTWKKTSELTIGLGESTSSYANHSEVLLVPGFWLIAILTGAYIAGNFREWSMMTTVVIIIPATPSNPSIPYAKRTSKHFVSWNALPW
jgi:hypothetical protein